MRQGSIFWRIVASFFAFTAAIALTVGILVYSAADDLGFFLIEQQIKPVMTALVTAERRWRDGPDRHASDREIRALSQAVGATFLVGKEVPAHWYDYPSGLTLQKHFSFVYLERRDGITYALFGSSRALKNFLTALTGHLLLGGMLALLCAGIVAAIMGHHLAAPLMRLAKCIDVAPPESVDVPNELRSRKDEIGCVARAIAGHQEQAQEYWRRETAFTGAVSHELRTPLAVIASTVEILTMGNIDAHTQRLLNRINRTVKGMSATVQSLLSLARKNSSEPQELDVAGVLHEQLELLRQAAICRGDVLLNINTRPCASGYADLVSIALANVLSNACRYSVDDKVFVNLDRDAIHVANKGDFSNKKEHNDSYGLGLSIAARACEKLGWSLQITEDGGLVKVSIRWPESLT